VIIDSVGRVDQCSKITSCPSTIYTDTSTQSRALFEDNQQSRKAWDQSHSWPTYAVGRSMNISPSIVGWYSKWSTNSCSGVICFSKGQKGKNQFSPCVCQDSTFTLWDHNHREWIRCHLPSLQCSSSYYSLSGGKSESRGDGTIMQFIIPHPHGSRKHYQQSIQGYVAE